MTPEGNAMQRSAARPALRPVHTERLVAMVTGAWRRLAARRLAQAEGRQLRVIETVQLGEKRFVSLLEVAGARYLVGGGAGQVTLLTEVGSPPAAETEDRA